MSSTSQEPNTLSDARKMLRALAPQKFNQLAKAMHTYALRTDKPGWGNYRWQDEGLDKALIYAFTLVSWGISSERAFEKHSPETIGMILGDLARDESNRAIAKQQVDLWFKTKFKRDRLGSCPPLHGFVYNKVNANQKKLNAQAVQGKKNRSTKGTPSQSKTRAARTTTASARQSSGTAYNPRPKARTIPHRRNPTIDHAISSTKSIVWFVVITFILFGLAGTTTTRITSNPLTTNIPSLVGIIGSVVWYYYCLKSGAGWWRYLIIVIPVVGTIAHEYISLLAILVMFPGIAIAIFRGLASIFEAIRNRS